MFIVRARGIFTGRDTNLYKNCLNLNLLDNGPVSSSLNAYKKVLKGVLAPSSHGIILIETPWSVNLVGKIASTGLTNSQFDQLGLNPH